MLKAKLLKRLTAFLFAATTLLSLASTALAEGYPVLTGTGQRFTIALGQDYGYAIKNDGTLWEMVFGYAYNESGRSAPTEVLSDVVSVRAGGNHSFALKSDGTVWARG